MSEELSEKEDVKETKLEKRPKDRLLNFLVAQTVIGLFAVILVFLLKAIGGEYYDYSKAFFNENFNKPININQVLDAKQTRQILAAQSTVFSQGENNKDNSDNVNKVSSEKEESDASDLKGSALKTAGGINSMCIPVNGKITSEYSYRIHPISGEYRFHSGLDIAANEGDDIKSVLDGTVTEVDTKGNTSYGKYIVVKHSSGSSTLYGHCSKIIAKEGYDVKKGEVIAKVGSTGNSTGPHLHFEVRVNGVRLNPRLFADFV